MMNDQTKPSTNTEKMKSPPKAKYLGGTLLRVILLDLPVLVVFTLLMASLIVSHIWRNYMIPIASTYKRGDMVDGLFYEDYDNDFTYYNRHCGPKDISTRSANDLLINDNHTAEQAADIMLQHGAVAFTNVLENQTATELRAYLATKHDDNKAGKLGYNEVFWHEQKRLSLGIGTSDHPAIAQAMQQIGRHAVIAKTLEGILGPDPVILEISTLTSLNGANDQGIHSDSDWFGSSLL